MSRYLHTGVGDSMPHRYKHPHDFYIEQIGRKKRELSRTEREEENKKYIKTPYIDTWKSYKPIRKGETVNYRLRHRKKIGMWLLYTGYGYDYVYSPEELNMILDYDEFIRDMETGLNNLTLKFAKLAEEMNDQVPEEQPESSPSVATVQNILEALEVKTSDGKFTILELVEITQPEEKILAFSMTSKLYMQDLIHILENSGMDLHAQLDEQDYTRLYVTIGDEEEPRKFKYLEKVEVIGDLVVHQMFEQKNYCLSHTRKTDASNHLYMQVTAQINKEYDEYVNKANAIISHEEQRWQFLA